MSEDNMRALQLASRKVYSARTKHIGMGFHFLRDLVQDNKILLNNGRTETQFANAFTKLLPQPDF
ncbi:unnamed protein product [Discosporangium mesarthrocarpum]